MRNISIPFLEGGIERRASKYTDIPVTSKRTVNLYFFKMDQYKIIRRISDGAFGTVYEA
jgi:hypothetical protein